MLAEVGDHTLADSCNRPNTVVWKGGLYIKTRVGDMQPNCLVDTCPNRSIMHPAKYQNIKVPNTRFFSSNLTANKSED